MAGKQAPRYAPNFIVWYEFGLPGEARQFTSREDALEWQQEPAGRTWLGRKVLVELSYNPELGWRAEHHDGTYLGPVYSPEQVIRHNGFEFHPGPETEEEAYKRLTEEATLIAEAQAQAIKNNKEPITTLQGKEALRAGKPLPKSTRQKR